MKYIENKDKLWEENHILIIIGSLRGLVDTDGSIFVVKDRATLRIEFSNGSLPLVKDFNQLCKSLGMIPQPKITKRKWKNERTGRISVTYKTAISSKKEVVKFLLMVQPYKWIFGRKRIEEELKILGVSLKKVLNYEKKSNLGFYITKLANSTQINLKNLYLKYLKEKSQQDRVLIKSENIRKIYEILKENGYSIPKISYLTECDFRGPLYRGDSMKIKSFKLLKELFKKYSQISIPFCIKNK